MYSSVQFVLIHILQVLDLLKCSLFSKTPLTDVFLGMKPLIDRSRIFSCDVKDVISDDIHITAKLVVRKSDDVILYAQGGQDFANLIIRFLTFSLGGVLCKLEGNDSLGGIDGLCKSIADLNEDKYFMSKDAKKRLLELNVMHYYCTFLPDTPNQRKTKVALNKSKELLDYGENIRKMILANETSTIPPMGRGFRVKVPEMYMVTDDLAVEPMLSPISSVYLLNRFKTSLDDLEEKVIVIGLKEVIIIIKS